MGSVLIAVVVLSAAFMVARAFRWRRAGRDDELRREQRDLERRRHHFRGSLEMEADGGRPVPPARPVEGDGASSG